MEMESRQEPPPPEQLAGVGESYDDVLEWLTVDEDTLEELMKVLETDNNNNPTPFHEEAAASSSSSSCINGVNYSTNFTRVRFIENPYSATVVFQASSSYITINGNEETCGSSFSDWEASVMASVDTGGTNVGPTGGRKQEEEDEKEGFKWDELVTDVDGGGGGVV